MLSWTRVTCLVVLACLATSPALAQDDGLTSSELRALPRKQADKQARRDLDSVLLPAGQYPHGMRIEVRDQWMPTRPYVSDIPGICTQDTLILLYAPVEAGKANPNRVVQPYGLESVRHYALLESPNPKMIEDRDADVRVRQRSACRSLIGNEETLWISAEAPFLIVEAWLAFDAAFGGISSGSLQLTNCSIGTPVGAHDCVSEFKVRHSYKRLANVDRCDAEQGQQCFRLDIDGMWITVAVRADADLQHLVPADIQHTEMEEYIVVT